MKHTSSNIQKFKLWQKERRSNHYLDGRAEKYYKGFGFALSAKHMVKKELSQRNFRKITITNQQEYPNANSIKQPQIRVLTFDACSQGFIIWNCMIEKKREVVIW